MIRSSKHTLKFANNGKRVQLHCLIESYRKLLQAIIDHHWQTKIMKGSLAVPKFFEQSYLNGFGECGFSARLRQACGKQAIAMIKAAITKRKKQLFMLRKLQKEGKPYIRLQSKIDRQPLVKPNASQALIELDSRFVDFDESAQAFDFVRIASIGNRMQLKLPFKQTKVSNKWASKGELKPSIRLSKSNLWLMYEVEKPKASGSLTIAADQGVVCCLTLSDGQTTPKCPHGHNLQSIQATLARRKKGSNSFRKAQDHRTNYVNWSIKQLSFDNVRELRLEKLSNVGYKQNKGRYLSHWAYALIKQKLVCLSEMKGFQIKEVPNEFRSQRCSECGWVRKANRKGKTFACDQCGNAMDADSNAASNLMLDLFEIPYWVRLRKLNRKGFYWLSSGLLALDREPIVPDGQKAGGIE